MSDFGLDMDPGDLLDLLRVSPRDDALTLLTAALKVVHGAGTIGGVEKMAQMADDAFAPFKTAEHPK